MTSDDEISDDETNKEVERLTKQSQIAADVVNISAVPTAKVTKQTVVRQSKRTKSVTSYKVSSLSSSDSSSSGSEDSDTESSAYDVGDDGSVSDCSASSADGKPIFLF